MKAIQIKYLAPTDTKPSRLKAWSESGIQMVEPLDYGMNIDEQARKLADKYVQEVWCMGVAFSVKVTGFGSLPNGDFVATVGS